MQQILGRVGAGVGAEQDRRLARVDHELLAASGVLATRGVEPLDRRSVMRPVDPAVGGAELELRQLRLVLDQIQRGEQLLGIHAVADRVGHCGHRSTSSVVVLLMGPCSRVACATRAPPPRFGSEVWRDAATRFEREQRDAVGAVLVARALRPLTGEAVARVGLDHLQLEAGGRDVLQGVAV